MIVLSSITYVLFGTARRVTFNYVSWFAVIFIIASYIRFHPHKLFSNKKVWGYMSIISIGLCCASVIACSYLGSRTNPKLSYAFVSDSNTFLAVLTALCTFLYFKNLSIKYSRFINGVAATTFGVLLIHTDSSAMRQWLWKDTLHNVEAYSTPWIVPHLIISVIGVFAICSLIDYLRIRFVETPFFGWWDKHENSIVNGYKRFETRVFSKLGID